MLTHIHIRDFAIVEQLDLDLGPGMTVLTGETGAGKSILIDALGLALGDRADSSVVRAGCRRTEVNAAFDLNSVPAVQSWLIENDLDAEDECLVRRMVNAEGRSRAYINGQTVPVQTLRQLGEYLVDIHGQHAHQSLLRREMQRQLLDEFAGHKDLLRKVSEAYRAWRSMAERFEQLRAQAEERQARLALLRFQTQELNSLNLGSGELQALQEEESWLANASRLMEASHHALEALSESEQATVLGRLSRAREQVADLQRLDPRVTALAELLSGAQIQIEEAIGELRRYRDGLDLDPARLHWVEDRLTGIQELVRKHHVPAEELPALRERLSQELADLEAADLQVERMELELTQLAADYRQQAASLSASRVHAGEALAEDVTAKMQTLGMPGGSFQVSWEAETKFSPHGLERVEFLVSANPGQPLRPLAKVASGGELSRISLALQVVTIQGGSIPTLVFDEVDVGIGGGVAEIVGRQLRTLGEVCQVLCVTHLPQVAAQGHQHLQVTKRAVNEHTWIGVRPLEENQRIEEIARMLGGIEITTQTLAHAGEMLASLSQ
jgi:DNA repair protein RecN (Recombination protein N)